MGENEIDFLWVQVSDWNFSPKRCIEKYVKSRCGSHIFQFYLTKKDGFELTVVESLQGVPEEILKWRNDDYNLKQPQPTQSEGNN